MRTCKHLPVAIAASLLCLGRVALGIGAPRLQIPELVADSDLVVVAEVSEIKPVGAAQVIFNGTPLAGQRYQAEAVSRYTLLGSGPRRFTVEVVLPNSPTGTRSVKPGVRILFLKKSGALYNPANPYYPDLPALASTPPEPRGHNVTEQVFAELGAVVASADAPPADKWEVLLRSYAIPDSDKSFLSDVLAGIRNTADPQLRWRLQAELITRNDVSQFPDVCAALLSSALPPDAQKVVLYAVASRLTNQKAVPELKGLLHSPNPEVRVASAQALWHTGSRASIGALIDALRDDNPDVRYYAIRGLADTTGQPQWGPGPDEYQQNEAKYLQHWLEWASQNPPRPDD